MCELFWAQDSGPFSRTSAEAGIPTKTILKSMAAWSLFSTPWTSRPSSRNSQAGQRTQKRNEANTPTALVAGGLMARDPDDAWVGSFSTFCTRAELVWCNSSWSLIIPLTGPKNHTAISMTYVFVVSSRAAHQQIQLLSF
jgi:hypothetical protein